MASRLFENDWRVYLVVVSMLDQAAAANRACATDPAELWGRAFAKTFDRTGSYGALSQ